MEKKYGTEAHPPSHLMGHHSRRLRGKFGTLMTNMDKTHESWGFPIFGQT